MASIVKDLKILRLEIVKQNIANIKVVNSVIESVRHRAM